MITVILYDDSNQFRLQVRDMRLNLKYDGMARMKFAQDVNRILKDYYFTLRQEVKDETK